MKKYRIRLLIIPAFAGLVFIALYIPVFIWLGTIWLNNPYYTHGFLIPPVSAFIAWTKRKKPGKSTRSSAGIPVLVAGLAVYIMGFLGELYWLWALSFLIVISGLLLHFKGSAAFREMLFPLGFLIFMIPLPFLDLAAISLQSLTAAGSALIIEGFGIPVTRIGSEIGLANATFQIGVPCSGMNTLISLLAISTLILYCLKSPFYKKVVLFILAVPIAVMANLFRVVLLLLIAHQWGSEAAMSYFHDYSSLLLFVMAVMLLILLARIFRCTFRPAAELLNG